MRVAFFAPSFPELSETFILRQVTGLLDRGHDVRVFAYRAARGGPSHEAVERYGLRARTTVLPHRSDRAPVVLPPPGVLGHLRRAHARRVGGVATLVRTLAVLHSAGPFDVVHCHYGHIGLRYLFAARLWRAPLVASFYGHDVSVFPREHGRDVYRPLFAAAHALVSLSGQMDDRLVALGADVRRLRRVPLAVDEAACGAGPRPHATAEADAGVSAGAPDAPRILTVARLTEKKGLEHALRAVALLRHELPGLRYEVIGEGPLRPRLEALARELAVHDVVRFVGARDGGVVHQRMREADVFLLPSVTAADGDEEGTPTVLLEAGACGLPVVSTLHAGIPEIVRDGESGYLVPEGDHEALAGCLRVLLRSPERRRAMGEAGRRRVLAEHTTAAVAGRLEALYAELLERAP